MDCTYPKGFGWKTVCTTYLSASTDIQPSHHFISKDSFGHKVIMQRKSRHSPFVEGIPTPTTDTQLPKSHSRRYPSSRAVRLDLVAVDAPSKAVELDVVPGNLLLLVEVEQVEALDVVAAVAHTAEPPLPEALVAVGNVDLAGLDVRGRVILDFFEPLVPTVADVDADLRNCFSVCYVK